MRRCAANGDALRLRKCPRSGFSDYDKVRRMNPRTKNSQQSSGLGAIRSKSLRIFGGFEWMGSGKARGYSYAHDARVDVVQGLDARLFFAGRSGFRSILNPIKKVRIKERSACLLTDVLT